MANQIQWPDHDSLPWTKAPRNEERVIVQVDVEPQGTEVAGHYTPHGKHFRLCYKSELPELRKRVQAKEHLDRLALAREMYERAFAEKVRECGGDAEMAAATIGVSTESFYDALPGGKGGRPPLKSLVEGPTVPAPYTPAAAAEQAQAEQAKMIASILADVMKQLQGSPAAKTK